MAEKKKKAKPFKTATGAQQFMRNFDLKNITKSTKSEINKMKNIFKKEYRNLINEYEKTGTLTSKRNKFFQVKIKLGNILNPPFGGFFISNTF